MEESFGAQYALQIALQTLRERCHEFQQRISALEEENHNLRATLISKPENLDDSFSEVSSLKQQISQLTEQNLQLTNNVTMVTTENRRLWARLSKLTQANENLGSKLTKINDTLSQPNVLTQSNLVRSKTFTQNEPHLKLVPKNIADENNRISLELEDISLKLICNIAKEKSELELQCSQMAEIQSNETMFVNTFAFSCENVDDTILDDFNQYIKDLKNIQQMLVYEKEKLQKNLNNLESLPVQHKYNNVEQKTVTVSQFVQTSFDDNTLTNKSPSLSYSKDCNKICPICSKVFSCDLPFPDFHQHVEQHFTSDTDNFSIYKLLVARCKPIPYAIKGLTKSFSRFFNAIRIN